MKNRIIFIIFILIIYFFTFAKDVRNLDLELQYNKYVQSIVSKFIPNSFTTVYFHVLKDSANFYDSNFSLDKRASLPGLPMAKTTTYIPVDKNLNILLPSKIQSKVINIYSFNSLSEQSKKMLSNKFRKILNLNIADTLKIHNINFQMGNSSSIKRDSVLNYKNLLLGFIFLYLIIFMINFKSGLRYLAKTIQKSALLTSKTNSTLIKLSEQSGSSNQEGIDAKNRNNGVIKVKLVREKKKSELTTDFSFLQELSNEKLFNLLKNEPIQDLPIILSVLPDDFCVYFCKNYKGPIDKLIKNFYSVKERAKIDLKMIRLSLYQKYLNMLEKDTIKFEGETRLCKIIPKLPYTLASRMLTYVKSFDIESYKKISKNIITIEKILDLEDVMIEEIVTKTDHETLVKFLKITDDKIRNKFFNTFSREVVEYLKREIINIEPIDDKEKELIIDKFTNKLKELLGNY